MGDRARAGIRAYTKVGLRVYDTVVMGWLAKYVWRCPADSFVQHYWKRLTSNHAGEVITFGRLDCDARRAWGKVRFYEHISRKPFWLLRTVLPTPQRTTGCYGAVGDESRCMYSDSGYLTKKIKRIDPGKQIDFDIIEQTIRYSRRIVLRGGTILIESHAAGTSSVRMLTSYDLRLPTFWVGRFLVDFVVAAMHKVVIRDMQDRLRHCAACESREVGI